jgi:hypothetical protein
MSTPTRGLADQEDIGRAVHLAGHHDLLLVAAREVARGKARVRRANVVAFHLLGAVGLDGGVVRQEAGVVFRVVVIAEGHVFPRLEGHDQAFVLPVLGHVAEAARAAGLAVGMLAGDVDLLVSQRHGAALRGDHAAEDLQQFGLPVAGNPRDAEDLARPDLEGHALHPFHPVAHDAQVVDLQHHVAGVGGGLFHAEEHLAPHHHLGQFRR